MSTTTTNKDTPGESLNMEVLKGQANYLRWKRKFKAFAYREDLLYLFTEDPQKNVKIEHVLTKPTMPTLLTPAAGADLTQGQMGANANMISVHKFQVKAYEKQQERIRKVKKLFSQYVAPSIYPQIQEKEPADAWAFLRSRYQMENEMAQGLLYRELQDVKLSSYSNIQEYLSAITDISVDLSVVGAQLPVQQAKSIILDGLPASYNKVVDQIIFEAGMNVHLSLEQLESRLLTYESILKSRNSKEGSGNSRGNNSKKSNNVRTSQASNNPQCPVCKKNHPGGEAECWFKHPDKNPFKKKTGMMAAAAFDTASVSTAEAKPQSSKPKKLSAIASVNLKPFRQALREAKAINQSNMCPRESTSFTCHLPENSTDSNQAKPSQSKKEARVRAEGVTGEPEGVSEELQSNKHKIEKPSQTDRLTESNHNHSNCFLTSTTSDIRKDTWLADTGANSHIVNDIKWFQDFTPLDMTIGTADGTTSMTIKGGGTVSLTILDSNGDECEVTLTEVAYAPEARCNLLSVSALCDKANLKLKADNQAMTFETVDGHEVGHASVTDGLYHLSHIPKLPTKTSLPKSNQLAAVINMNHPVMVWHRRLGHLGFESMRKLLKQSQGMNLTDKEIQAMVKTICPICATTRAINKVPRSPARRRYEELGELVHIDTWGPYPIEAYDGTRYFVLITDDATRWTWYDPINSRDEVTMALLKLHRRIERTKNTKIRRYRCDNEFVQRAIIAYCETNGVEMEAVAPYAHHQNGVEERAHRTIRERASAMTQELTLPQQITKIVTTRGEELLRSSSAPEILWNEAFKHAIWLKNRSPTKSHKYEKTPFELVEGRTPDLSRERIWGSRAYVTSPPEKRIGEPKLHTPRGWLGYFVGCESESVYRIWHPEEKKVYRISVARIDDGQGLDDHHDEANHVDRVPIPQDIPHTPGPESSAGFASDDSDEEIEPEIDNPRTPSDDESELSSVDDDFIRDYEASFLDSGEEVLFQANVAGAALKSRYGRTITKAPRLDEDLGIGNESEFEPDDDLPTPNDFGDMSRQKRKPPKSNADTEEPKPKKTRKPKGGHSVPDSAKCDVCFKEKRTCNGERPCDTCIKKTRVCRDQTAATKALIPMEHRQDPDKTSLLDSKDAAENSKRCQHCHVNARICKPSNDPLRCQTCVDKGRVKCNFDYDPDTTPTRLQKLDAGCYTCKKLQRICDGGKPCGKCKKDGIECRDHPEKKDRVDHSQKCGTCQTLRLGCNGKRPCDTCLERDAACKPVGWQQMPKCTNCQGQSRDCDRSLPCGACIKTGRTYCSYRNENDTIWRGAVIKEDLKTNLTEDSNQCHFCRTHKRECDGNQPCNFCVRNSRGKVKHFCTYDLTGNRWEKYRTDCYEIDEDNKIVWKEDYTPRQYNKGLGPGRKPPKKNADQGGNERPKTTKTKRSKAPPITDVLDPNIDPTLLDDSDEEPVDADLLPKDDSIGALVIGSAAALSAVVDPSGLPLPQTYHQAIHGREGPLWQAAIQTEFDNLEKKSTWSIVDLPAGKKPLTLKLVLKRKIGPDGKISRYKARLVARGFLQKEGVDFTEVFAAVVKPATYRLLFALATHFGWSWVQWDAVTAFLNATPTEQIYARPPAGYPDIGNKVLLLKKALYGLKQSPRLWYEAIRRELEILGFTASKYDPCLFIFPAKTVFVFLYVDNINVIVSKTEDISWVKKHLFKAFEMTDEDESFFLGMNIQRTNNSVQLNQPNAIEQILRKFDLEDLPTKRTPITRVPPRTTEGEDTTLVSLTEYRSKTGSLIYPASVTRPDIAFASSVVGRFSAAPAQDHLDTVHNIIGYLKATPTRGVKYQAQGAIQLQGFVDSDFAGCVDTARSTTGWVFTLAGGPISWCSQRQKTVSLSTTEAEYIAASEATKEAIWLKGIINELDIAYHIDGVPLHIDNDSAMKLTKNAEFHARTKHINVKHHFIREHVRDGTIIPIRVSTEDNLADAFTKPLARARFEKLMKMMGVVDATLEDDDTTEEGMKTLTISDEQGELGLEDA